MYTATMIGCQCDKCGELYEDPITGFSLWVDINSARESACDRGDWVEDYNSDKIYCPNCATT